MAETGQVEGADQAEVGRVADVSATVISVASMVE